MTLSLGGNLTVPSKDGYIHLLTMGEVFWEKRQPSSMEKSTGNDVFLLICVLKRKGMRNNTTHLNPSEIVACHSGANSSIITSSLSRRPSSIALLKVSAM